MQPLRRERIFLLVLILLVVLATSISVFAYAIGGTRGAEEWFHLLGGNGENGGPGASLTDTGDHAGEPEPVLVVDLSSYLIILFCLAVVSGVVWLWYSHRPPG